MELNEAQRLGEKYATHLCDQSRVAIYTAAQRSGDASSIEDRYKAYAEVATVVLGKERTYRRAMRRKRSSERKGD